MYAPITLLAASLLVAWVVAGPGTAKLMENQKFERTFGAGSANAAGMVLAEDQHVLGEKPPALLPPDQTSAVDRDVVEKLLKWIGRNTEYDVSGALRRAPKIRFVRARQKIQYEGTSIIIDIKLKAAYDSSNRIIFLVEPWAPSNIRNLSSLVHELIHDVQFLNRDWPCSHAPEWEAYKLQEMWLGERGIDPHYNWFQIQLRSRCRNDIHP